MRVAAIQMTSGPEIEENLLVAESFIRQAAESGAEFVVTPEVTDQIITGRAEKIDQHFLQDNHPGIPFFSSLAKELNIHLLIGSMCVRVSECKLANRSFLFAPDGSVQDTYDKIHLFDVNLPTGEAHLESRAFEPGRHAVTAHVKSVTIGLTICYDMRFPHLYRDLGKAGVQIIAVPSAFTVPTGEAHWHSLLRARAIEAGCFIIAPAQVGDHAGVRVTYGHSLIIDPWGKILVEKEEGRPGIITADLDLNMVEKVRQSLPSLKHDRPYDLKN